MERKDDDNWVKPVKYFEVEGRVLLGKSNKTWNEVLKKNLDS